MSTATAPRPQAFSYLRMSTLSQREGDSERRQLERSENYAALHGLELVDAAKLKDIGKSAYTGAHLATGVLGEFVKSVEAGEVAPGSFLLVEDLDRLSRGSPIDAVTMLRSLASHGIIVVTTSNGQRYTDLDGDFTQLILSMLTFHRANQESRLKSGRLAASWENKRSLAHERPMTSVAPKWLKPIRDAKGKVEGFAEDPDRVKLVQRIFEESALGIGAWSIARRLNSESVPTFGRSKGWQASYIKKILGSRAVLGEFVPHKVVQKTRVPEGEVISAYYPAIISETLFLKSRAAIHGRGPRSGGRTGANHANLFKNLLHCAHCDGAMRMLNKGQGSKGGRYLICDAAHRGLKCAGRKWRYDHFERAFLRHSVLDLALKQSVEAIRGDGNRIEVEILEARQRLSQLQNQARAMDEAFGAVTRVSDETLKRRGLLEQQILAGEKLVSELELRRVEKHALVDVAFASTEELDALSDPETQDILLKRANAARQIAALVKRIDVAVDGPAVFFSDKWRDRLDMEDDDVEEVVEGGIFADTDQHHAAPTFAVQFKKWPGGAVVQPYPPQPKHRRFWCPLRPENYRSLSPSDYRLCYFPYGSEPIDGEEAEGDALQFFAKYSFTYSGSDEWQTLPPL